MLRTVSLPELWVAITPGQSDDTEFPTALQFGDVRRSQLRALVAHEVAHQWVYSLVGNNQAENPWLDESLATFGEGIAAAMPAITATATFLGASSVCLGNR
ncbi:MAG: M1 family aminopeptidase [Pseudonocardiaceae bacterium]